MLLAVMLYSCANPERVPPPAVDNGLDTSHAIAAISTDTLKDFVLDNFEVKDKDAKKLLRNTVVDAQDYSVYSTMLPAPVDTVQRNIQLFNLPVINDTISRKLPYYEQTAMSFGEFAAYTGGEAFAIDYAKQLPAVLVNILNTHATSNTDIVFLIDNTGSMYDDIDELKTNLTRIIGTLKGLKNIHIGFATYSDSLYDRNWFRMQPLSDDLGLISDGINAIKLATGGDMPESVNDAVVRTVSEMNWTVGSKRMMLLLGDAPSQIPPMAKYTHMQALKRCIDNSIWVNIYPVIIKAQPSAPGFYATTQSGDTTETRLPEIPMLNSLYPNPAVDQITMELGNLKKYSVVINSSAGDKMFAENILGVKYTANVSAFAPGTYFITVTDLETQKAETKKFVKL